MLTVSNLTKTFPGADEPILSGVTFTVNPGERVGLIGPNGAGKTTLLRCILGETAPDAGSVQFNPPTLRVGYLPQGLDVPDDMLVRDVLTPGAADRGTLFDVGLDFQQLGRMAGALAARVLGGTDPGTLPTLPR